MAVYWKGEVAHSMYRLPGSRKQYSERLNATSVREADVEDKVLYAKRLEEWKRGQNRGSSEPQDISWAELVEKYLGTLEGGGDCAETLNRVRQHFKQFDRLMNIHMASECTIEVLEDFKLRCRREGMAPGTTNKALGYLKGVLRVGRRLKKIVPTADDLREVRQVRNRPPTPVHFGAEEQLRIIEIATPFWIVATLLGGQAGLRRSEAISLRWQDISFSRRELHVVDRPKWREKTRKSKTIPIHKELLQVLTSWRTANPDDVMVLPWKGKPHEFTQAFRRLCRRAGLGEGSFKSLRHGFGTGLTKLNNNASMVQKAMGHSNIQTTQTYTHVSVADLHEVIDSLPSSFDGGNLSNHFLTKLGVSTDTDPHGPPSTSTKEAQNG